MAVADRNLTVDVGVDASTKRDGAAIVALAYGTARPSVSSLVYHQIFQPSKADPLDLQVHNRANAAGAEAALPPAHGAVRSVANDGCCAATATRQPAHGRVSADQRQPHRCQPGILYELIQARNLVLYPDAQMRLAVSRAVAIESSRGWRYEQGEGVA